MKILVVDKRGSLLDLVLQLELEAHDVVWHITRDSEADVGEGLSHSRKVDKWSSEVKDVDLVVLSNNSAKVAESLRGQGISVIGGEYDSNFVKEVAKTLGSKPATNTMPRVVECVGGWFNGYRFAKPLFVSKKYLGLMEGGRGPNLFMGLEGRFKGKYPKFHELLSKLGIFLKARKFTGYLEIDFVDGKVHDVNTSLANPSFLMQMELFSEPVGNFLHRIAKGTCKDLRVWSRCGVGVALWGLPAPLVYSTDEFKNTIVGLKSLDHFHIGQVKRMETKEYRMAGTSGFVGLSTGHAKYYDTAKERAYNTLMGAVIPNSIYRTDIGG